MSFFMYWIVFIALVIFFILLDLGIFHRTAKVISIREALLWSLFWICLALLFNVGVFFIYEYGVEIPHEKPGSQAALEFFTGYVLEKSLSLDNIFVFSMIFSYYHIPLKYQRRVLTLGISGAVIMRGIFIVLGIGLIHLFSWMIYLFGAILIWSGYYFFKEAPKFSEENFFIKCANRIFPIASKDYGGKFFIKREGRWMMTPCFLTLLQIETADLIFAVDSIPAIFAITLDPFIVFTSNIFAILGLRSLYFSLAPLMNRFSYLKPAIALILIFIGIKMILADLYPIPNVVSLFVITLLLVGSIVLSLQTNPFLMLWKNTTWILTFSLRQARRLVVFVIGTTILLLGIILFFIPGPAVLVIPLGIFILSIEFVWAKRFLEIVKDRLQRKK